MILTIVYCKDLKEWITGIGSREIHCKNLGSQLPKVFVETDTYKFIENDMSLNISVAVLSYYLPFNSILHLYQKFSKEIITHLLSPTSDDFEISSDIDVWSWINKQKLSIYETKIVEIRGVIDGRKNRIFIDENEILVKSTVYPNVDGFIWGYGGTGPFNTAIAILMQFVPYSMTIRWCRKMEQTILKKLEKDKNFTIRINVINWIQKQEQIVQNSIKPHDWIDGYLLKTLNDLPTYSPCV